MSKALFERLQANLNAAIERREALTTEMEGVLDAAKEEKREQLTADEDKRYAELEAQRAEASTQVNDLSVRVKQLGDEIVRDNAAADAIRAFDLGPGDGGTGRRGAGGATVAGKDLVYTRDGEHSYFQDLIAVTPGLGESEKTHDARERLQSHAELLDRVGKDMPSAFRAGPAKRAAGSGLRGTESRANPSRIGGQGGYFVPPLWKIDEWVPYLRAGRTTANLFDGADLPSGTDSINLPKLTLGTLTGPQSDNGAVVSQDITDSFVTAPVRTIAGQEDIAIQLLEQSPIGPAFDQILGKDLLASYNQQVDIQAISGTGLTNQILGLASVTGINAISYTSGSPSAQGLYPILGQAASNVARLRFAMPTAYVVTPQRWFWLVTQLDSQGRPLVLPKGMPGFNAMGNFDGTDEGLAGEIFGIPIYVDANIASTVNGNQDTIYAAKFDDLYLMEGAPRVRTLMEVLSGTLQVRVQLYNYVASLPQRFPQSISAINGTGLVSPAGF